MAPLPKAEKNSPANNIRTMRLMPSSTNCCGTVEPELRSVKNCSGGLLPPAESQIEKVGGHKPPPKPIFFFSLLLVITLVVPFLNHFFFGEIPLSKDPSFS